MTMRLSEQATMQAANQLRRELPREAGHTVLQLMDIIDRLEMQNRNLHRALIEIDPTWTEDSP